jgi:hypothetical protein
MEVLHPRCCGRDVHKSSITACICSRNPANHSDTFVASDEAAQHIAGA